MQLTFSHSRGKSGIVESHVVHLQHQRKQLWSRENASAARELFARRAELVEIGECVHIGEAVAERGEGRGEDL